MFQEITYLQIFGKPLILYGGVLTLLLLLLTAAVSIMNKRGITIIPFKWHIRLAAVTLLFALVHASLGILAYF